MINFVLKSVVSYLMKDTLEYKILKHLSHKNNGRFIDISEIESDQDFLKSVIADLKNRELIITEPYPRVPWKNTDVIGDSPSEKPEKCKIKLSGIEYLDNMEKSEVNFKLAKETLKQLPTTKIIAIIGLTISVLLLLKELYTIIYK
jgi:hypothetical protein